MDFDTYRQIDAVNWSSLRAILRSPLHYRHGLDTPREDTPAMALGRAVHTAILEPDRFVLDCAVRPDGIDRRTKEGKAAWATFVEANAGKTILDADDYARCLAVRDAVHAHPIARDLVRGPGGNEVSQTWTDPTTGLRCKGRFDRVSDQPACIVDLKTTRDVDSVTFGRAAARLGYHGQLAFYQAGWEAVTGVRLPCVIVAVESDAPHDVAVIDVDEDSLEAGRDDVRKALALLVECRESGVWPGRYPQRVPLQLPSWVFPDEGIADLDLDFGDESEEAA